jgi:hypothetical protein
MSSLRVRIGSWVAGTFVVLLVAFTAASIRDERERLLSLERSSAASLLQHLAAMPEFARDRSSASVHVDPIQSAIAPTGAAIDLIPAATPFEREALYLATQRLSLADGEFELRYRVRPDRLAAWTNRSIAIHSIHGAIAIALMLGGVAWILRRHLVEPAKAMALQVRHMARGVGWQQPLPSTDAEVGELEAALRDLGPAMEEQAMSWVEAERRAAVAHSLSQLRGRIFEHERRALATLSDLEARGMVIPEGKAKLRGAIAEVERIWGEIRAEEELRFGARPSRAAVAPAAPGGTA